MVQATWSSGLWQIFESEAGSGNSVDSMLHWGDHLLLTSQHILKSCSLASKLPIFLLPFKSPWFAVMPPSYPVSHSSRCTFLREMFFPWKLEPLLSIFQPVQILFIEISCPKPSSKILHSLYISFCATEKDKINCCSNNLSVYTLFHQHERLSFWRNLSFLQVNNPLIWFQVVFIWRNGMD
jgi:hypothetical protein